MVTLQIQEDSAQAKQFIAFAKTLPFVDVNTKQNEKKLSVKEIKYLAELKIAAKQAKYGVSKNLDDVLNEL